MNNGQFDLNTYLSELEQLVNQDSGSDYPQGNQNICDFFIKKYSDMGWIINKHNFEDSIGPCLEAVNIDSNHVDILFIGHMDTVFRLGTAKERPFTIKNNKAYGPGVIDMKSGLLSLYYVMKLLDIDHGKAPSFCIALNSDEEISSKYSSKWIEELAKRSKYTFVLEPARENGALVIQRKGLAKYRLEFTGVAAHAGIDIEKGASAITELGYWIVKLSQLSNYQTGTTVNVGVVSGGTKANVIADKAYAEIDVRFDIEAECVMVENKMNELRNCLHVSGTKVKVKIERVGYRPPMNQSEKTKKLCSLIDQAGERLGIDIQWASAGGGSDANFTAALGIPSIDGLGPVGGGQHGVTEYLDIATVEPRIRLLKEIVETIIK